MVKIIEKINIVPNTYEYQVSAPDIARKSQPGHFIILIPDQYSERIPITLADWDSKEGTVTIIFLDIGAGTQSLSYLNSGDNIYSFTGPLGNPFKLDNYGTVGLVGGCYGIGAIYSLAKALKAKGNKVICYSEARSSFLLYWDEQLESVSDEVRYSTVDGSRGYKGHAYDQLSANLKSGEHFDKIYAVGCTYMMYKIAETTRLFGIKTIVSMNPVMVDGTGMCGACRLVVGNETKFACVDGPHFDGHKINWDLVLKRRKAYLDEEIISKERL